MDTEKQLLLLRGAYLKVINILYTREFRIRLTAVCSCDKEWYESHLTCIDTLCSAMEHTIMENNPRRAMRYLCLLRCSVNELIQKTETDYVKNLKSLI